MHGNLISRILICLK